MMRNQYSSRSYGSIISWLLFSTLQPLLLYSNRVSAAPIELHGINYNTRQGPDFAWDKCKSMEQIRTDLNMLSRVTSRIRILSLADCGQGDMVLTAAKELGLQVWLGVWISEFEYVFEGEKGALFNLINNGLVDENTVLGVTVGSEAVYREEVTAETIIDYMNQIRGILADGGLSGLPVTITEIAPTYSQYSNLRSAVDVIYANIFPFWEGININGAIADMVTDLDWVMNLPESAGKELIIGETGWPESGSVSAEDIVGNIGIPSVANQVQFFRDFYCEIGVTRGWKYYWFTAIDNKWRQAQDIDNTIEGTFGFLDENLQLKSHFQDLSFTCNDGVTYNFAETDWTVPNAPNAPVDTPTETLAPNETPREAQENMACSVHAKCAELGLLGSCCPTNGLNPTFLSCCDNDNLFATPTTSPSKATPSPTRLTPSPTVTPPTPAGQTPSPTRVTPSPTRITPSPTRQTPGPSPATPEPTRQTPSPTLATPGPTRQTPIPTLATPEPTKFPTLAPITPAPSIAPVTREPSTSPVTLDPTVTPLFPSTGTPSAAPITQDPTSAPVTSEPTAAPTWIRTGPPSTGAPTSPPTSSGAPSILVPTIDIVEDLEVYLFGMLSCRNYCLNAFEAKLINHIETFYASSTGSFQVLENIPRITGVGPIFMADEEDDDDGDDDDTIVDTADGDTRKLQVEGNQVGVRIIYDHTFEWFARGSGIMVEQLAGLPFASEDSRDAFVASLKQFNVFDNMTEISSIVFPEFTSAPTSEPTEDTSTRPPSSTAGANQDVVPQPGEVYSIGVIVGIAVGGSALLLLCLFCFCYAKKKNKDQGSYAPPGDDFSFGFSTVYTKEQEPVSRNYNPNR
ncbi:unnamed protein product [Cylindrotheca closterium]|uniref:glucan endo-1,3-beta-D-glucosidase n=1 Tax=Cylindrotheca closterium TaxID=2856 RepID=A0AAD2PU25_9STRA|nr:unnamed protein product [Cylindrotheca closterium]